jgi:hypothetical protein
MTLNKHTNQIHASLHFLCCTCVGVIPNTTVCEWGRMTSVIATVTLRPTRVAYTERQMPFHYTVFVTIRIHDLVKPYAIFNMCLTEDKASFIYKINTSLSYLEILELGEDQAFFFV